MEKEGSRFSLSFDEESKNRNFDLLTKNFVTDMGFQVPTPRSRPNESPLMLA
jgi:hypothetical protein